MDEKAFIEYLQVKKAIDDRSLNRLVWETLIHSMPAATEEQPWQVVEIGAGIGTMIQRLMEWDFLHYARYTALDASPLLLKEASQRLTDWARQKGFRVTTRDQSLAIRGYRREVEINFLAQELSKWLGDYDLRESTDLIIAHAFLDLINLMDTLPPLMRCLKPDGLFYFTINFDGLTVFEPPIDEKLDEQIIALYHRSMEERKVGEKPSAGALSGRRLIRLVEQAGGTFLRIGASDWVVHPIEGVYPPGEARFLRLLLQMIGEELEGREEIGVEPLRDWLDQRNEQIEKGQLSLVIHQLDFVGRRKREVSRR